MMVLPRILRDEKLTHNGRMNAKIARVLIPGTLHMSLEIHLIVLIHVCPRLALFRPHLVFPEA